MLTLLADGKTDRQIAELLFINCRNVNTHVANILGVTLVCSPIRTR